MSDLFIGSNHRPNRPEAINFKPVARPDVNQVSHKVIEKGDEFCKCREKTREKLFQEKDRLEKGCIEKGKEKITFEKDLNEKSRTEKCKEKITMEKDSNEKSRLEKDHKEKFVEKCFEKPGEKRGEKLTKEKDHEKFAEKAIWPPEDKGSKIEKNAEKACVEKRIEKFDEKFQVEKRTEKGDLEKLNVEKNREKCFGEKHFEILPLGANNDSNGAVPSDRFFYKG